MSALPEVVRATVRGVPDVVVFQHADGTWFEPGADYGLRFTPDERVTDRRPLVLIDPEDCTRQALEIAQHAGDATGVRPGTDIAHIRRAVEDALRSLAQPAPPEPTGLGAVVRGRWGSARPTEWSRNRDGFWVALNHGATRPIVTDWASLNDVTVLHEGWSE